MARRLLRQKLGSPAMGIALGVLALLTAIQAALSDPERALGAGIFALALIGAGSVSRDASSGALQMILARPIRRTHYLFGRYLGILAAYAIYVAATAAIGLALSRLLPRLLGSVAPAGAPTADFVRGAGTALLNALLFAAILLCFSTFLRGYADVLAYILLSLLLGLVPGLGQSLHADWLRRFGETLRENVLPNVDWSEVLRGHDPLREATGRYVLAVVAFLTLATVIFSRREFAYGQD